MTGIHRFEIEHGLPKNYINVSIVKQGEQGAFQRLERGELNLKEFYKIFGEELSHPDNKAYYRKYLQRAGKDAPDHLPDIKVDGKVLFMTMIKETLRIDPKMMLVLQKLRASGQFKLAALTNNFPFSEEDVEEAEIFGTALPKELASYFDHIIESRVIGLSIYTPAKC
ncbi:hypothetical protein DFQ28_010823 [Apophysomyces sp. BC1034]|nr:hypothetical protein DFQ28_010823 [Apophysomyces sp. BC1034]